MDFAGLLGCIVPPTAAREVATVTSDMAGKDAVRDALDAADAALRAALHAVSVARAHADSPATKVSGCRFCGADALLTAERFGGADVLCRACGRDQSNEG